jgi:hypothetical protein
MVAAVGLEEVVGGRCGLKGVMPRSTTTINSELRITSICGLMGVTTACWADDRLKEPAMQDKPTHYPNKQHDGQPLKPITQVLLDRRATPHFIAVSSKVTCLP